MVQWAWMPILMVKPKKKAWVGGRKKMIWCINNKFDANTV